MIDTELEDQTVIDGDEVMLECTLHGTPKPRVFWYHNKKKLKNSSDFSQTYDGKVARLVIAEVLDEDDGEYMCFAINKGGETKTECQLTVKGN